MRSGCRACVQIHFGYTVQQPQILCTKKRVTFTVADTNKQPVPNYCTEIPPGVMEGKEKAHV